MQNPTITGSDYDPKIDGKRLARQYNRIFDLMSDGKWRTLREISDRTNAPEPSVSAQLRHAKKPVNGGHDLDKRRRDGAGLYEYRLIVREPVQGELFV